jgi:hypothetical protein
MQPGLRIGNFNHRHSECRKLPSYTASRDFSAVPRRASRRVIQVLHVPVLDHLCSSVESCERPRYQRKPSLEFTMCCSAPGSAIRLPMELRHSQCS